MAITGRGILLALLAVDDNKKGISGITRFQKLLYLITKEDAAKNITKAIFDFVPYKMGPYSSKLYDDLEMMENLGLLESSPVSNPTAEELAEGSLNFDDLMGEDSDTSDSTDSAEEKQYRLTEKGISYAKEVLTNPDYAPVLDSIRKVKSRFSNYSLQDLLYYVYTKYPEDTTESMIKDQVFRKGK